MGQHVGEMIVIFPHISGYTQGMKTAVSIPDPVYRSAERFARRRGTSRSALYSRALSEYLARHASRDMTEAMNSVCADAGEKTDPFLSAASARILKRSEW